jgi:chitodextrinase
MAGQDNKKNQAICRIALFMIWLIVLTPVYTANALVITFNPSTNMSVLDNAVNISWTTDDVSTGKVKYGIQDATETIDSRASGKSHKVEIKGIASNTTFMFFIESSGTSGTNRSPAEGGDSYSFTTLAPIDRTPPNGVKGLAAATIGKDSISFSWEPDARDLDIDHYVVYKAGVILADSITEKSFTDTGLNMSTEYVYLVAAVDTSGNIGPKTTLKATTRSESFQSLIISDFKAEAFGTSVYVAWTTNIASHTRVRYGVNPQLLDQKKESSDLVTSHNLTLADLAANSDITLIAESCDQSANCGNSTQLTVKTTSKVELALSVDRMDCDPATAAYANSNRLDVNGRASPGADVNAFINGKMQRFKRVTSTGTFSFQGMDLDPAKKENEVKIVASDRVSAPKECLEKILLDYYAPQVDFTNDTLNLTIVTDPNAVIKGNLTDEHKVTLYAYLQSVDDTTPPPAPVNIRNTSLGPNTITIAWDKFSDADAAEIYKFYIYRSDVPDGPIAAVDPTYIQTTVINLSNNETVNVQVTQYQDNNVSTGTTYTYQVSAVDKAGNEGAKSYPFSLTTASNGTQMPPISKIIPPNPGLKLTKEYNPGSNPIPFAESIGPLFNGTNNIRMQFVDEAGNVFEKIFKVVSDREPPRILTPTAAEMQILYSPSYTSDLLIAGQINKPSGQVWIWVNNASAEPTAKIDVGENGTFEAEVSLLTSVIGSIESTLTTSPGSVSAGYNTSVGITPTSQGGRMNKVILVAVDSYGRKSNPIEANIEYTPCSKEMYWDIKINAGGSIINSKELITGVAAYGFGFELTWMGGGDVTKAKVQGIPRVTKATVGTKERLKYDFDWIGEPRVLCRPNNCTKGFVMIPFIPIVPVGNTSFQQESNISKHRKGECWPGVGCVHLLLQMEIASDPSPLIASYGATPLGAPLPGTPPIGVQKQCIDIKIALDQRLDPSIIPKGLLIATIDAINATLNFLNMIEKPVTYTTQITLGVCLFTFATKFFVDAWKNYQCKWGVMQGALAGGAAGMTKAMKDLIQGGGIERIASMDDGTNSGACFVEFEGEDSTNKAARDACKTCASAIGTQRSVNDKFHLFCDRVMCPSVPSLQHYIFQNWKAGKRSLWTPSTGSAGESTNACPNFNPNDNGGGAQLPNSGGCNCTGNCGPSTPQTAFICQDTKCLPVTAKCADNAMTNVLCRCYEHVCVANQYCDPKNRGCTGRNPITGMSSISFESWLSGSQSYVSGDSDSVPLITGYQAASAAKPATPAATPAAAKPATPAAAAKPVDNTPAGAKTGKITPPVYDRVIPYEKGNFKRTDVKAVTSDCSFAEMGRGPVKAMYDFYTGKTGSPDDRKLCAKGHLYQAACCPFEYMNEWGWGMMFSNEVALSYCLAAPEDKNVCGVSNVVNGVTGICQPSGSKPKAVPVMLNDLKWRKTYPAEGRLDDVVYVVDLDDKGSAKSVQRMYDTKNEIKQISGQVEQGNRIEISTGSYLKPDPIQASDMTEWFSVMDNADISKDEDRFGPGLVKFGDDIIKRIETDKDIEFRSNITRNRDGGPTAWKAKKYVGSPVEEWYRQVSGLMGEPKRQYIAQPAGSFVQSLVTLCLSGISSWIIMLKMMLTRLYMCLNTILLTGDGSAGQCQAILSQYICDIIYEAISCIVQKMGGTSSARVGAGGIGGVFASINDAGRGVMAETQKRYGDRNLFATQFAAENLVHDACIFMFTGEWPTDWSQLFKSAAQLPVNSSIFVFPVTRRWQAYDPASGYARYAYRVAFSVFAGAPIHFDLKLVCSGYDLPCTNPQGCDCAQMYGRDPNIIMQRTPMLMIPRHQSGDCPENGDLRQFQSCTEDIMFVSPSPMPLRYDKAVVEYRPVLAMGQGPYGGATVGYSSTPATTGIGTSPYAFGQGATGTGFMGTMASPAAISGRAEGDVVEIGSPPLGLCEFSLATLSFRCGVEIPALGYARFITVDSVNAPTLPYGVGDKALVRIKIEQVLPSNLSSCSDQCESTKYLVIKEIKNQNNAVIYPKKQIVGERLNQNKMYDLTFMDDVSQFPQHVAMNGQFVISPADFGTMQSTATNINMPAGSLRSNVVSGTLQAVGVTPPLMINISYNPDKKTFRYETGSISSKIAGAFVGDGRINDCGKQAPDTTGKIYDMDCGGFTFKLNNINLNEPNTLLISYAAPTGATGTAEVCPRDPVAWTMTLEIRGSDCRNGGCTMTAGPDVDPDTNRPITIPVKFMVQCGAGTSRNPATGSIESLTMMTANVKAENTQYNSTYGLWIEPDTLGPTEAVSVGDFKWLSPGKPQNGFSINIGSSATQTVLSIDVTKLNIIPGPDIQIQKGGTILKTCGEPPCVDSTGDANTRVIRLRMKLGDPQYTFTGFQKSEGLAGLVGGAEATLTLESAYYPVGSATPFIMLYDISQKDVKVTIKDYVQNVDGMTLTYSTVPDALLDVAVLGFNLSNSGFVLNQETVKLSTNDKPVELCPGAASGQTPTFSGVQYCYYVGADDALVFVTKGTKGEKLSIRGLSKKEGFVATSILDAPAGAPVILTAAQPEKYGMRAANLYGEDKITITNIVAQKETPTFTMNIESSVADADLTIELLRMGFVTGDSSKVDYAGLGTSLPSCGTAPCLVSDMGQDRIIIRLPKQAGKPLRVSGLYSVKDTIAESCVGKAAGATCKLLGYEDWGTCWEPAASARIGMACFSQCSQPYFQSIKDKITSWADVTKYQSDFCIDTSKYTCTESTLEGGCPGKLQCCSTGNPKPKPVARGGGSGRGSATCKNAANNMLKMKLSATSATETYKYDIYSSQWIRCDLSSCAGGGINLINSEHITKLTTELNKILKQCAKPPTIVSKNGKYYLQDEYANAWYECTDASGSNCQNQVTDQDLIAQLNRDISTRAAAEVTGTAVKAGTPCGEPRHQSSGYVCTPNIVKDSQCKPNTILTGSEEGTGVIMCPLDTMVCCQSQISASQSCNSNNGAVCLESSKCKQGQQTYAELGRECQGNLVCCKPLTRCANSENLFGVTVMKSVDIQQEDGSYKTEPCGLDGSNQRFCIEGYTGSQYTCVIKSDQAFLNYYCSKAVSTCASDSCLITDSNYLKLHCPIEQLPSSCKRAEYDNVAPLWGLGDTFFLEYSDTKKGCANAEYYRSSTVTCTDFTMHIKGKGSQCYGLNDPVTISTYCAKAGESCKSYCDNTDFRNKCSAKWEACCR